jgi:uncharacterized protein YndB with AHSA1/START domain
MNSEPEKRDLVVTRVFAAPVERVWKAWSDSELVMQWWGPTGFTCAAARMEIREGGTSLVCMRAPKEFRGHDMYNTWTYEKIVPMSRFVYIHRFSDKDGNPMDPVKQGLSSDIPKEMRHEVTFRELGKNKTEVRVIEYGWPVLPGFCLFTEVSSVCSARDCRTALTIRSYSGRSRSACNAPRGIRAADGNTSRRPPGKRGCNCRLLANASANY